MRGRTERPRWLRYGTAFVLVVLASALEYPVNTTIGVVILLVGIPAYFAWSRGREVEGDAL